MPQRRLHPESSRHSHTADSAFPPPVSETGEGKAESLVRCTAHAWWTMVGALLVLLLGTPGCRMGPPVGHVAAAAEKVAPNGKESASLPQKEVAAVPVRFRNVTGE